MDALGLERIECLDRMCFIFHFGAMTHYVLFHNVTHYTNSLYQPLILTLHHS